MSDNIFQVINEDDIEEIKNNNRNKLVSILIPSVSNYNTMKSFFYKLSLDNKDSMFIVINSKHFTSKTDLYKLKIPNQPITIFTYNNNNIALTRGSDTEVISNTFYQMKERTINVTIEKPPDTLLSGIYKMITTNQELSLYQLNKLEQIENKFKNIEQ